MKFGKHTFIALCIVLVLGFAMMAACGDDDDDDDDDDGGQTGGCGEDQVCQFILDTCPDAGGYTTVEECKDMYFSSCFEDIPAFTECICECLETVTDCGSAFVSCDMACYELHCV